MAGEKRTVTLDAVKRMGPNEFLWDAKIPGFGVRRQKSEARTYLIKTRISGRQRWFTIGRHGAPWTPETARKEALRILGEIAAGGDLASDRDDLKKSLTVAELCERYIEDAEMGRTLTKFGNPKKQSTIATDRGRIARHIVPLLGQKRLDDVTQMDIKRFMQDVATGKTAVDEKTGHFGRAIVKGGRGTASRTVGLLGGIFSYAIDHGWMKANPAHGVKRFPDKKEERFLTLADFGKLGDALQEAEASHDNFYGLAAIRLLMLTGCRKSEILTLRWEDVDFENCCLRLPDSKTGEKVVILGAPALGVLTSLPRLQGNPYVLPGKNEGQHLVGLPQVWRRVRERAGLEWATLHILRHSFASFGAGTGLGLPIIGKLLGHKDVATTARYAKIDADPARAAALRISLGIAAAMGEGIQGLHGAGSASRFEQRPEAEE